MRPHRRIPIYWPALMTVTVTLGGFVAPANAGDDGDAVPPTGDAVVVPDPAPPAPTPPEESEPDTSPATAEPTESEPPADSDESPTPPTTQPPVESEGPATTVPNAEPEAPPTTQPPAEPEAPPTTQPPADSEVPTTTVPDAEPEAPPTLSPAERETPPTTVPNTEPEAPATSVPAAGPDSPAHAFDKPAAWPTLSVVSTPVAEVDEAFAALAEGIVRPISFPVLGPVKFYNDWGACRDACTRHHEGNDLIGVRMQPLLAAVDGTVTRIRDANLGTEGLGITVTGADGWYYNYFHVNNDAPGTDDGAAGHEWEMSPLVTVGSRVRAGQVIAYMGDSGNAESSVPHLHFEIRQPDHTPVNPYPSLVAARARQTCSGNDPGLTLSPDAAALSPTVVAVIPIDGGGRWLIDASGLVYAEGSAAYVSRIAGLACPPADPVANEATGP